MSDYQQKEMSGSLFKNSKKEKDTHPDVRGTCKIGGVDYRVSGWNRTTKGGAPWISLAFTKADDAPKRQDGGGLMGEQKTPAQEALAEEGEPEPPANPRNHFANMDDNVPF